MGRDLLFTFMNPPCSLGKLIVFLAAPACVRLGNARHVMYLMSGFVVRTVDSLLSSKPGYMLLVLRLGGGSASDLECCDGVRFLASI